MKCKEIQFELPLYFDDVLSSEQISDIDAHLDVCPVCRQKVADMGEIRNALRAIVRPQISQARLKAIRSSVGAQLSPAAATPGFRTIESSGSWASRWLMPYTVGAAASVVFGLTLLSLMLTPIDQSRLLTNAGRSAATNETRLLLANTDPMALELTPSQYAGSRLSVAGESPSINPSGALVALTKSFMRGEMKDDEVVVVADVFGNGLARIAEVVEAPHDRRKIEELQKALQSDPAYAPFVPSKLDRRADSIRVVLKIQSVDVDTSLPDS